MGRLEVQVTGLGGQGVILLAYVVGKAAALHGGRHAVLTQSFGPEARGSACAAQVVLDDERIAYPYITRGDLLVAMSQAGYERYVDQIRPDGVVFYDAELVRPRQDGRRALGVQAARLAEGIGRRVVQNMVMLGFFACASEILPRDALARAVQSSVPRGTEEMNLRAFNAGWEAAERAAAQAGMEVGA